MLNNVHLQLLSIGINCILPHYLCQQMFLCLQLSCNCSTLLKTRTVPSCMMFDRANSNVKLASSSRVESSTSSTSTGALEYEYERSSARVRGVRSSSEARVRVLECSSFTH